MGSIFTQDELIQQFKKKVIGSPQSISLISKHALVLLKQKYEHQSSLELSSNSDKLYQILVNSCVLNSDQKQIELQLRGFNSLTHQKFYNAIQKVLKLKGSREMESRFELTTKPIKFPYSRNNQVFPAVKIAGESKSKDYMEITITGASGVIVLFFFLKSILKTFLKSIEDAQPNNLWEEEIDSLPDESRFTQVEGKREIDEVFSSTSISSKKTKTYDSEVDANKIKDVIDNQKKEDVKMQEVIEEVKMEDVSSDEYDEKSKVELFATSSIPVPATRSIPVLATSSIPVPATDEMSEPCYFCALIDLAENIRDIVLTDNLTFRLTCVSKCICSGNCLEFFVESLSSFVCISEVNEDSFGSLKRNIVSMLETVLDKTPYTRADLFCKILDNLGNVKSNLQHRIISMLRELSEVLIGNNIKLFEETIKSNKLARRNMIKFLSNTGNFFSLQALVETWNIMDSKGVNCKYLLPPYLHYITDKFSSNQDITSSNYFFFTAEVTRDIITNVLRGKNIAFIKALKIEFKHGAKVVDKPWDSHIYINKVENIIYHILGPISDITCEAIHFHELKYEPEEKKLYNETWNFFLPEGIDTDLFELVNKIENKQEEARSEEIVETDLEEKVINKQTEELGEENIFHKVVSSEGTTADNNLNVNADLEDDNVDKSKPNKYWNNDDSFEDDDIEDDNLEDDDLEDNLEDDNVKKDERGHDHTIETSLSIPKETVSKYWNADKRSFIRNICGEDWPKGYGSPCAVIFQYVHTKKFKSAKRINHFSKLIGNCKICNSKHVCIIEDSPFNEKLIQNGKIKYETKSDLQIEVTVTGKFELNQYDDTPDITKPKHNLMKATGLFLKGKDRQIMGEKVSNEGVQTVFMKQFDDVDEDQLKSGNKTGIKSYDVLMNARQEYEKKLRCGNNFFESVQNIVDSQHLDISLNFEDTAANRELAGFVRSVQRTPFKIVMANYDQLRIGANYLNKKEMSIIFMDSSGRFLTSEKGIGKLLNTAICAPPPAKGHSPFPLFEMVSEKNKTIDFQSFIDYGWSYLSTAINNKPVRYPKVAVTDFSFPNIHACLASFNKVKIKEYIEVAYNCALKGEELPFGTILTICENHTLPNLLKFARNLHKDKVVADTLIAGILMVFEAETFKSAMKIFENLAVIHCSTEISEEARQNIKEKNFEDFEARFDDFGDEAPEVDNIQYGTRTSLREHSKYYKLFKKIVEKILEQNKTTKTSNKFYAPKLMLAMIKQYLSLYPLFSASFLPDKKLKTNSYIELYWRDQRRILKDVPDRLRWPPRYLGNLHSKIRRDAKSIVTHGTIPNLKHGGKVKPGQTKPFEDYLDDENVKKSTNAKQFIPAKESKTKRKGECNESYGGSFERWDSQKSKDQGRKKDNYIKGKTIDHNAIIENLEIPFEHLKITGTKKLLTDPAKKATMPETIVISSDEIEVLLTKHQYISSEVVDGGLILLDKKLNLDCNLKESIFVYTVLNLRLILNGEEGLVNKGNFLAVFPRDFGRTQYTELQEGDGEHFTPGSHFTLVSNLQCKAGEVNIYETFEPFRTPESLLTTDGIKLLKILTHSSQLRVNCIDVQLQDESECGAISLGLAVQLCFYASDEDAIQYKLRDVRKELFRCLKNNQISYFAYSKPKIKKAGKVLFSMNC